MGIQADDQTAARRGIRRMWLWWGIPGGLVAAVVGWWWYVSASAQARFDATLDSLKAQGFALRLQDLAPPAVPDEENAALLYLQAAALFEEPDLPAWRGIRFPMPKPIDRLSEDDRNYLKRILHDNAQVLGLLRQARGLPKCRFQRDYSRGIGTQHSDQSNLTKLTILLRLSIAMAVFEGWHSEALGFARDAFALADCYRDEPFQFWQMGRFAMAEPHLLTLGCQIFPDSSRLELEGWLSVLPPVSHYDGMMAGAFKGEVAMLAQQLQDAPLDFIGSRDQRPPLAFVRKPGILRDGALTLEVKARQAGLMTKPWWEIRPGEWTAGLEDGFRDRSSSHPVAAMMIADEAARYAVQIRLQARLAVLREGLEWEITNSRDGHYPDTPAAVDPYNGKPLRVDTAKGLLWSVGRDGVDGGGNEGDIVWKLRHHP